VEFKSRIPSRNLRLSLFSLLRMNHFSNITVSERTERAIRIYITQSTPSELKNN